MTNDKNEPTCSPIYSKIKLNPTLLLGGLEFLAVYRGSFIGSQATFILIHHFLNLFHLPHEAEVKFNTFSNQPYLLEAQTG